MARLSVISGRQKLRNRKPYEECWFLREWFMCPSHNFLSLAESPWMWGLEGRGTIGAVTERIKHETGRGFSSIL